MDVLKCTRCNKLPRRKGGRWCLKCHAAYARKNRLRLVGEARRRANARSYAHVYIKRGKLKRQPCRICGSGKSQMHHENYDRPLEVDWMCAKCRQLYHRIKSIADKILGRESLRFFLC